MHWPPKAITFFSGGEKEVEESKKKSIMLPAKGNRKSYCSSKKVKLQFRRKGYYFVEFFKRTELFSDSGTHPSRSRKVRRGDICRRGR